MSVRRVLFVVHLDSFFTTLIKVAGLLRSSGRFEPVFLFAQAYSTVERDKQICRTESFRIIGDGGPTSGASRSGPREAIKAALALFGEDMPGRVHRAQQGMFVTQVMQLHAKVRSIRSLIADENISVLILGGDIAHYDTSAYVKAAHEQHVPVVVMAGWMINQNENAEAFMFEPSMQLERPSNRIVGKLFPRWTYHYKDRALIRLPASKVLARELLGLAPPRPWTLHSGYADRIAVESEAMREACVREGLPVDQVVVTGSIVHDLVADTLSNMVERRTALYRELGFADTSRPMLLTALPPNELYRAGGRPECDFKTYDELVRFWVDSLVACQGWNVVISLHPSVPYESMRYLEETGARIATYPRFHTAATVAMCSLFVASVSTTIQWATACGKPIINYDVYRYRQNDYDSIPGMKTVEEQADFVALLERATTERAFLDDLARAQATVQNRWGRIDGKAGSRILGMLDSLMGVP